MPEVLMYYRGFDGPVAGHAEWWFLSVFGCPENSFNEGGLKTSAHGYGAGQWNFFHATTPAVNVRQYIIDEVPSPGLFFRLPNYPSAPSILRRIVNCEAEREALANQVPNLQNQVAHEAIHNWNEARKNGGGGGIGGIGGVDDGKKGDGKKGSDGAGADGADGWLKSGCICPETPPCPVVIPCPEPVVCNIAKIQIQLNSTLKSLDECKKQKDQTNDDLNVCQSHKDETQGWLTDCQKEYVKQTSHSSKDDTLTSLRNCQSEYRKETFKKDKLCRGLSRHIIGITDFCEEQVEKLRLANCE
ncbi:hypothetical protein ACTFIY_011301 [Dictyostelium cf. discoideum]